MSPVTTILKPPSAPCLFTWNSFGLSSSSACPSTLYPSPNLGRVSLKLTCVESRYRKGAAVCLFGGKENPENGNEASPWKSLEEAVGSLKKERSIEDVLRDQIQKGEFYDGGSSGGKGPGGSGGGKGSGGSGEPLSDDEGFSGIVDEVVQAVLATMGFAFLYMFILEGEDIIVLARDLIKLLFTRQRSIRLRRLINDWKDFLEEMKEEEEDPQWLPRALFETSSSYDSATKYQWILENNPDMLVELIKDPESVFHEQSASHEDTQEGEQ